jgi:hypothetical protein
MSAGSVALRDLIPALKSLRVMFSGVLCCVSWQIATDVSKDRFASIFKTRNEGPATFSKVSNIPEN